MKEIFLKPPWNPHYVGKRKLAEITGVSTHTWKVWRIKGLLIEDIHWLRLGKNHILYCLPLILDFLNNRHDPAAHQRAIENYQATLLSNQSNSRRSACSKKGK